MVTLTHTPLLHGFSSTPAWFSTNQLVPPLSLGEPDPTIVSLDELPTSPQRQVISQRVLRAQESATPHLRHSSDWLLAETAHVFSGASIPLTVNSLDRTLHGIEWHELSVPEDKIETLYEHAEQDQREASLFSFNTDYDRGYEIRVGDKTRTDSTTFGDAQELFQKAEEDFFGTECVAHVHVKKSTTDSNLSPINLYQDLTMILDRAHHYPGQKITHVIFGHVNGERAFVEVTALYNQHNKKTEFQIRTSRNYASSQFRDLNELAEGISASSDGSQAHLAAAFTAVEGIGTILLEARDVFEKHQKPASRVSLREVARLNRYVQCFAGTDGLDTAVIQGLWLILGASLDDRERNSQLARDLKHVISKRRIGGLNPEKIERLIEENSFNYDSISQDATTIQRQLQRLTGDDDFFKYMSHTRWFEFLASIWTTLTTDQQELYFGEWLEIVNLSTDDNVSRLILSLVHVPLTKKQFNAIVKRIKEMTYSADQRNSIQALGKNKHLSKKNLIKLKATIPQSHNIYEQENETSILIGQNPHCPAVQGLLEIIEEYINDIKEQHGYDSAEAEMTSALKNLARNPSLTEEQINQILSWAPELKRTSNQFSVLLGLCENPNLTRAHLLGIFAIYGSDRWPDIVRKPRLAQLIASLRSIDILLDPDTFSYVTDTLKTLSFVEQLPAFRQISRYARLNTDQIRVLLDHNHQHYGDIVTQLMLNPYISESDRNLISQHANVLTYNKIYSNDAPAFLVSLWQGKMTATDFAQAIENHLSGHSLIQLIADHPESLPEDVRDEIIAHYRQRFIQFEQAAVKTGQTLSSDAASIDLFDHEAHHRLQKHADTLAGILSLPRNPQLTQKPYFDPKLVSGHNLLSQLVQALTISRFALVTGPPASGKSEAGRYLAEELGWDHWVVNCHQAISEEELMQKIGIKANGDTGFVITDGPLADALIHGKLFIFNEMNLAKSGALAFLFSILADVNLTFSYYDATTGETRERVIHPAFRFIATQNPDGPGRKELNAAFKNRSVEIFAPELHAIEKQALLKLIFPNLETRYGKNTYEKLVGFYEDMQRHMAGRIIGDHIEGYSWTLRNLIRLAKGFDEAKGPIDANLVLSVFFQAVGTSLTLKDREEFFKLVRKRNIAGIELKQSDQDSFQDSQNNQSFDDVFEKHGIDKTHAHSLKKELVSLPTAARFLDSLLYGLLGKTNLWLKGPAGTGKTKLAHYAARLIGATVFEDTFTPQTDQSQLKGQFQPVLFNKGKESKIGFKHVPSELIKAIRAANADRDGRYVMIMDEAAFAKPAVLEEINSAIDRDGGIWV